MRWRLFLSLIGLSLLIVLCVSLGVQMHHRRTVLTVATSPDYCPYEFVSNLDGQRALVGFDIDVANAIAARLYDQTDFQEIPFSGLLPSLKSETIDLAIAAITPTEERQRIAQFSDIYYEARSTIVSRHDALISTPEKLSDRRIGVKPGTIHEQWLKTSVSADLVPFQKAGDGLKELRLKQLDAVVMDRTIANQYDISRTDFYTLTLPNEEPAGVAIAFPRSSRLVAKVNGIIQDMQADGTLDTLVVQWFDDYICDDEAIAQAIRFPTHLAKAH